MDSSSKKIFSIPKKPTSKDNLVSVSGKTRDAQDILQVVWRTYLDYRYKEDWIAITFHMVNNSTLLEEFRCKKQEMKDEGRTTKELQEMYAFSTVRDANILQSIAAVGLKTSKSSRGTPCLGNHELGVTVCKHADVILRVAKLGGLRTCRLIIHKIIPGRRKMIVPRYNGDEIEPTPNYDCHMSSLDPSKSDLLTTQENHSQIFLYEYTDEALPSKRPRHCLPYAVITYLSTATENIGKDSALSWESSKRKPSENTRTSRKSDSYRFQQSDGNSPPLHHSRREEKKENLRKEFNMNSSDSDSCMSSPVTQDCNSTLSWPGTRAAKPYQSEGSQRSEFSHESGRRSTHIRPLLAVPTPFSQRSETHQGRQHYDTNRARSSFSEHLQPRSKPTSQPRDPRLKEDTTNIFGQFESEFSSNRNHDASRFNYPRDKDYRIHPNRNSTAVNSFLSDVDYRTISEPANSAFRQTESRSLLDKQFDDGSIKQAIDTVLKDADLLRQVTEIQKTIKETGFSLHGDSDMRQKSYLPVSSRSEHFPVSRNQSPQEITSSMSTSFPSQTAYLQPSVSNQSQSSQNTNLLSSFLHETAYPQPSLPDQPSSSKQHNSTSLSSFTDQTAYQSQSSLQQNSTILSSFPGLSANTRPSLSDQTRSSQQLNASRLSTFPNQTGYSQPSVLDQTQSPQWPRNYPLPKSPTRPVDIKQAVNSVLQDPGLLNQVNKLHQQLQQSGLHIDSTGAKLRFQIPKTDSSPSVSTRNLISSKFKIKPSQSKMKSSTGQNNEEFEAASASTSENFTEQCVEGLDRNVVQAGLSGKNVRTEPSGNQTDNREEVINSEEESKGSESEDEEDGASPVDWEENENTSDYDDDMEGNSTIHGKERKEMAHSSDEEDGASQVDWQENKNTSDYDDDMEGNSTIHGKERKEMAHSSDEEDGASQVDWQENKNTSDYDDDMEGNSNIHGKERKEMAHSSDEEDGASQVDWQENKNTSDYDDDMEGNSTVHGTERKEMAHSSDEEDGASQIDWQEKKNTSDYDDDMEGNSTVHGKERKEMAHSSESRVKCTSGNQADKNEHEKVNQDSTEDSDADEPNKKHSQSQDTAENKTKTAASVSNKETKGKSDSKTSTSYRKKKFDPLLVGYKKRKRRKRNNKRGKASRTGVESSAVPVCKMMPDGSVELTLEKGDNKIQDVQKISVKSSKKEKFSKSRDWEEDLNYAVSDNEDTEINDFDMSLDSEKIKEICGESEMNESQDFDIYTESDNESYVTLTDVTDSSVCGDDMLDWIDKASSLEYQPVVELVDFAEYPSILGGDLKYVKSLIIQEDEELSQPENVMNSSHSDVTSADRDTEAFDKTSESEQSILAQCPVVDEREDSTRDVEIENSPLCTKSVDNTNHSDESAKHSKTEQSGRGSEPRSDGDTRSTAPSGGETTQHSDISSPSATPTEASNARPGSSSSDSNLKEDIIIQMLRLKMKMATSYDDIETLQKTIDLLTQKSKSSENKEKETLSNEKNNEEPLSCQNNPLPEKETLSSEKSNEESLSCQNVPLPNNHRVSPDKQMNEPIQISKTTEIEQQILPRASLDAMLRESAIRVDDANVSVEIVETLDLRSNVNPLIENNSESVNSEELIIINDSLDSISELDLTGIVHQTENPKSDAQSSGVSVNKEDTAPKVTKNKGKDIECQASNKSDSVCREMTVSDDLPTDSHQEPPENCSDNHNSKSGSEVESVEKSDASMKKKTNDQNILKKGSDNHLLKDKEKHTMNDELVDSAKSSSLNSYSSNKNENSLINTEKQVCDVCEPDEGVRSDGQKSQVQIAGGDADIDTVEELTDHETVGKNTREVEEDANKSNSHTKSVHNHVKGKVQDGNVINDDGVPDSGRHHGAPDSGKPEMEEENQSDEIRKFKSSNSRHKKHRHRPRNYRRSSSQQDVDISGDDDDDFPKPKRREEESKSREDGEIESDEDVSLLNDKRLELLKELENMNSDVSSPAAAASPKITEDVEDEEIERREDMEPSLKRSKCELEKTKQDSGSRSKTEWEERPNVQEDLREKLKRKRKRHHQHSEEEKTSPSERKKRAKSNEKEEKTSPSERKKRAKSNEKEEKTSPTERKKSSKPYEKESYLHENPSSHFPKDHQPVTDPYADFVPTDENEDEDSYRLELKNSMNRSESTKQSDTTKYVVTRDFEENERYVVTQDSEEDVVPEEYPVRERERSLSPDYHHSRRVLSNTQYEEKPRSYLDEVNEFLASLRKREAESQKDAAEVDDSDTDDDQPQFSRDMVRSFIDKVERMPKVVRKRKRKSFRLRWESKSLLLSACDNPDELLTMQRRKIRAHETKRIRKIWEGYTSKNLRSYIPIEERRKLSEQQTEVESEYKKHASLLANFRCSLNLGGFLDSVVAEKINQKSRTVNMLLLEKEMIEDKIGTDPETILFGNLDQKVPDEWLLEDEHGEWLSLYGNVLVLTKKFSHAFFLSLVTLKVDITCIQTLYMRTSPDEKGRREELLDDLLWLHEWRHQQLSTCCSTLSKNTKQKLTTSLEWFKSVLSQLPRNKPEFSSHMEYLLTRSKSVQAHLDVITVLLEKRALMGPTIKGHGKDNISLLQSAQDSEDEDEGTAVDPLIQGVEDKIEQEIHSLVEERKRNASHSMEGVAPLFSLCGQFRNKNSSAMSTSGVPVKQAAISTRITSTERRKGVPRPMDQLPQNNVQNFTNFSQSGSNAVMPSQNVNKANQMLQNFGNMASGNGSLSSTIMMQQTTCFSQPVTQPFMSGQQQYTPWQQQSQMPSQQIQLQQMQQQLQQFQQMQQPQLQQQLQQQQQVQQLQQQQQLQMLQKSNYFYPNVQPQLQQQGNYLQPQMNMWN